MEIVIQKMIDHQVFLQAKTDQRLKDHIKKDMALEIAHYLMENGLVKYTYYEDPLAYAVRITARLKNAP